MKRILFILTLTLAVIMPASAQNDKDKSWMYHDTINEPLFIMRELLVTPDGSDPVTYILDNVYRKAKENRKRLNYTANADISVMVRDVDIIPEIAPKTLMFAAQMYLRTKGLWGLFNYAMSRPTTGVHLQTTHTARNGKVQYGKGKILQGPSDMKEKIQRQLFDFCEFDLFDELYGENTLCDPKYRQKFEIKMEGTFEEGGKTIYILKARRYHGELRERQTLHIVDGTWGIRRAEYTTRIFRSYRECKDIGGGVYMPWRKVDNPVQFDLNKAIEKGHQLLESREKVKRMERKTLQRAEKVSKGTRTYSPMVKMGYEIHYRH